MCVCVCYTHLLKNKLIAFNTAFGGRLRGELAKYMLGLRLVLGNVPSRLQRNIYIPRERVLTPT